MQTEHFPHKVAAVYHDGAAAETAVMALEAANPEQVSIVRLAPGDAAVYPRTEPGAGGALSRETVVSAAETAAAAVEGNADTPATAALFVSVPVVGPLVVLGYGAIIGSTSGAIRGLRISETMLARLVRDVLDAGYYCIVVHAASGEAQRRTRAVIDATVTEEMAHS
ncbi:MAG: hypothetical protein PVH54_05665 [Gammaproteobacteria bacterium]|jgi:hypothetical protein